MTDKQKELLERLRQLVADSREAGFDRTLAFDLDSTLEFYERRWGHDK